MMALKLKTTKKEKEKRERERERRKVSDSDPFPLAIHLEPPDPARSLHSSGRGCPAAKVAHAEDGGGAASGAGGEETCALPASRALAPRRLTPHGGRRAARLARLRQSGALAPALPARATPSAPRAPRWAGFTLGVLTRPPELPSAGEQVFQSPHYSLAPSSLLPGSAEGPALGMRTPALLSLLSRRLCLAAAVDRKLAPGPGPKPRQGRRG